MADTAQIEGVSATQTTQDVTGEAVSAPTVPDTGGEAGQEGQQATDAIAQPEQAGQDQAGAPMDAASARSLSLITEHFGVNASGFPAEVIAQLAQKAESAMFDQILRGGGQPVPPQNQPQSQQLADHELKIDFSDIEQEWEQAIDKPTATLYRKGLDRILGEFNKKLAPLAQMQQAFEPIARGWAEHAETQAQQRIDGFFGNLLKNQPVWKTAYEGPAGAAKRQQIIEAAVQIKAVADRAGHSLSGEQALMRAHLAMNRDVQAGQAVAAVRSQVEKRSKQITTPPGSAVSSGKRDTANKAPQTAEEHRARAIAELKPVFETYRETVGA